MIARRQSGMCLVRPCRSETQGRARHASARKCRPAYARRTTLRCPALRPGSTERRRVWPATQVRVLKYGCSPCHVPRSGGNRHRCPSACSLSAVHEGRQFDEGELVAERTGGRRPKCPLCYTTASIISCARGLRQGRARSSPLLRCAGHLSNVF